MSAATGWFSVKRGITQHPLFKGNPERLAIWIWLIDNAVWQDTEHDIKGKTITVRRGQVAASERRIAEECGVGYQVVRTFLARLKAEQMINAEVTQGRNVITLCNYERYQSSKNQDNAEGNATLTQRQRTKEQDNNSVPNGTGDEASPKQALGGAPIDLFGGGRPPEASSPSDPDYWRKQVFTAGLQSIRRMTGKPDGAARTMLGRWLRDAKDDARRVLRAIEDAEAEQTIDPVAWITRSLSQRARQPQRVEDMLFARH